MLLIPPSIVRSRLNAFDNRLQQRILQVARKSKFAPQHRDFNRKLANGVGDVLQERRNRPSRMPELRLSGTAECAT
jgi:hypothetical protein